MKIGGGASTPDLLRAAELLAKDNVLNKSEVELVVSLATDGGGALSQAGRKDLLDILDRYQHKLAPDARMALSAFLGQDLEANRPLMEMGERLGADGRIDPRDVHQLLALVRSDGRVTAEERRGLELLTKDKRVQGAGKNLIEGFLRTLRADVDALPFEGRRSSMAQVVSLRAGAKKRAAGASIDPDKTPVAFDRLKTLLGQNAAEGHLLVALGVATKDEAARIKGGQATLREFYALAAKGHFGDRANEKVTYRDFRQAFVDAALEHDFTRIMDKLPAPLLEKAKNGEATPAEIFSATADVRAAFTGNDATVDHTALVGELAKNGKLKDLEEARALMSPAELKALESGQLTGVNLELLLSDAKTRNVDVVIIGAGMAGLAAAEDLMAQGKTVVILEASDRVGGRTEVDTRTFGGAAFDVGAAWLHAAHENPLTPITAKLGFTAPLDEAKGQAFDGVGDPDQNMHAFKEAVEKVGAAWKAAGNAVADPSKDTSVAAATPDAGPWTGAAVGHLGPLHMGTDAERVSAADFAGTAEEVGDRFVKEGFGSVVASFGHGAPVRLNSAVAKVKHGPEGAEVTTWGGKKYRAKTVLTTASTNVLASGKIAFDPPLPEWKKEIFEGLPLASFNKIALQFDKNVFGNTEEGAHVRDMSSAKEALEFVVRPMGLPVVVGILGGEFSEKLIAKGKDAAIEHALSRLEKMYGPEVRESFVTGRITDWDNNPWAMGSFSAAKPGYADARKDYEKPVGKTLYFAGEAGDEFWAGCVPGAYLSGKRAAEKIAGRLEEAAAFMDKGPKKRAA